MSEKEYVKVFRVRLKGFVPTSETPKPDEDVVLNKDKLIDVFKAYGKVSFCHISTPFSGIVMLEDMTESKRVKKMLDKKSYFPVNSQYSLQIDIVSKDFNRIMAIKKKQGPRDCQKLKSSEIQVLVPGLIVIESFIETDEEDFLISCLQKSSWEELPSELTKGQQPSRRRVLHYGHKFDYSIKRASSIPLNNWPAFLEVFKQRVEERIRKELIDSEWKCDQATVNEYVPGEGIAKHVDTHSAFKDGIASLSLGSDTVISFGLPSKNKVSSC